MSCLPLACADGYNPDGAYLVSAFQPFISPLNDSDSQIKLSALYDVVVLATSRMCPYRLPRS